MSVLERIIENNLLVFAIAGAGAYVIFYTEVGSVIRCALNPTQCLKKPFDAIADATKDFAQHGYDNMKDGLEKPHVTYQDHGSATIITDGGFEVHKTGYSTATMSKASAAKQAGTIAKCANNPLMLALGKC